MSAGADVEGRMWTALGRVRDPELDESITTLGFVASATFEAGVADVALRLPTYFCAPNFAWMMVADAREALSGVEGVERCVVRLQDHFAADDINAGVESGLTFDDSFASDAAGGIDSLRALFRAKAYLAALARACSAVGAAATGEEMAAATLAVLPATDDTSRLLRCRRALGLGVEPGDALVVDEHGTPVPAAEVTGFLRRARTVQVSVEGNTEMCRGLLATRYNLEHALG